MVFIISPKNLQTVSFSLRRENKIICIQHKPPHYLCDNEGFLAPIRRPTALPTPTVLRLIVTHEITAIRWQSQSQSYTQVEPFKHRPPLQSQIPSQSTGRSNRAVLHSHEFGGIICEFRACEARFVQYLDVTSSGMCRQAPYDQEYVPASLFQAQLLMGDEDRGAMHRARTI